MAYTNIDNPSDYFNTVLYTGNGSTQSITGVGFQPDWTSIKRRSGTASHGAVFDVIRGATVQLSTSLTDGDDTRTDGLTSLDSDGFSLGADTGNYVNTNNETFVSWNWLAGGTASSNTDGSITSTVSANTTSGFSIVSYTGTGSNPSTVGHGLGAVPKMIIVKNRDQGTDWNIYHQGIGNANTMLLNTTNASFSSSVWNSTTPTSSVFSLGANDVNTNTIKYIAYCFAEKKGFSKFGSYIGNGSSDGPMIYTGFKPAFVITKRADTGGDNWHMLDNKRDIDNPAEKILQPNESSAEETTVTSYLDFLSNGFKCRGTGASINTNGLTYVYMAFAESPFTTSTGIPTTAR